MASPNRGEAVRITLKLKYRAFINIARLANIVSEYQNTEFTTCPACWRVTLFVMIIITAHPDRLCEPGFEDFTLYDDGKEEVTTMDAYRAYCYVRDVIKGRFPEGEKTISQDAHWAYYYARDVIKGRWPEAEEAIAQNPFWAHNYALYIIEGRWPEAEEIMSQDTYHALQYKNYGRSTRSGYYNSST